MFHTAKMYSIYNMNVQPLYRTDHWPLLHPGKATVMTVGVVSSVDTAHPVCCSNRAERHRFVRRAYWLLLLEGVAEIFLIDLLVFRQAIFAWLTLHAGISWLTFSVSTCTALMLTRYHATYPLNLILISTGIISQAIGISTFSAIYHNLVVARSVTLMLLLLFVTLAATWQAHWDISGWRMFMLSLVLLLIVLMPVPYFQSVDTDDLILVYALTAMMLLCLTTTLRLVQHRYGLNDTWNASCYILSTSTNPMALLYAVYIRYTHGLHDPKSNICCTL